MCARRSVLALQPADRLKHRFVVFGVAARGRMKFLVCAFDERGTSVRSGTHRRSDRLLGRKKRARTQSQPRDPFALETPLLQLSKHDVWTIGDACEGTQIFGATGSGKTSGSGQAIAKAMLRSGFGGLVLCAKADEKDLWLRYAAETGRSHSVMVFGPDQPYRFNFLDYEYRRGAGSGLTENIVALFTTVLETIEGGGGGQSQDPFWGRALRQLLRNTIDLLTIATGQVSLPEMAAVIATAPQHPDDPRDPSWRARSRCWQLLEHAEQLQLNPSLAQDLRVTARYWCDEFPRLADNTRSSIVATFTTMADGLMRGQLRELFCTTTDAVPELTHKGIVIILDLPVKRYHEVGRVAQVIWKYCWQRATEARLVMPNARPVFLWADEAQLFINEKDPEFQATARSSKAATVYLTQNVPSYQAQIGGVNAKASAESFLGVLQTKIFHANGDVETNRWAQETIAQNWGTESTTSSQKAQGQGGRPGQDSMNTSTRKALKHEVLAHDFTTLRTGGPSNRLLVDAIVFKGGRVWRSNGKNHLKTTFSQQ